MNEEQINLPAVATPQELIAHAGNAAAACKEIVLRTAMTIQGKRYVKVEGWQAIAIAHGCVASARDVEELESGWKAIGEVRRMDTGIVIATAEGFVGRDEKLWQSRPEYASRAMAQTRAVSRACRSAFAHIVVLLNAGLETTPAEEIPLSAEPPAPPPIRQPERKSAKEGKADGAKISDAQAKRFFAIFKGAGHADEDVRLWLGQLYGLEHSRDILRADYDAICARMQDQTPLTADLEGPPEETEVGANG